MAGSHHHNHIREHPPTSLAASSATPTPTITRVGLGRNVQCRSCMTNIVGLVDRPPLVPIIVTTDAIAPDTVELVVSAACLGAVINIQIDLIAILPIVNEQHGHTNAYFVVWRHGWVDIEVHLA